MGNPVVRRLLGRPLVAVAVAFLLIMVLGALLAPLVAPQNPYRLRSLSLADSLLSFSLR